MTFGVVVRYVDSIGTLVPKRGGYVSFVRDVCDVEPRQGSLCRFSAKRPKGGGLIANRVQVLDGNSGGATGGDR